MTQPVIVDLPHRLGAEEARSRIARGIGRLEQQVPGGATVHSEWQANRLNLRVEAMGQQVAAHIDVDESSVRVELLMPAALAFFATPIEAMLRRQGTKMLEAEPGGAKS